MTELINNLTGHNHAAVISALFKKADRVTLVSPFLLADFNEYLENIAPERLKEILLITTLVPRSADQIKKMRSLTSLLSWCKSNDVRANISVNNKLHGKLYFFQREGEFTAAVLSSANFTGSGLYDQHEWGVEIRNQEMMTAIYSQVTGCIEFEDIRHEDIARMAEEMSRWLAEQAEPSRPQIPVSLLSNVGGRPAMRIKERTNFWLKPIGSTGNYVSPRRDFSQKTDYLHFAKREPKNITVGDIFIAFAVGSGRIISVYRMMTNPHYTNAEERWPWYITGRNLTPDYGRDWWEHNLDIYALKQAFENAKPGKNIRPSGSQSYGGFQWGWDRLQITGEFADFIINQAEQKTPAF